MIQDFQVTTDNDDVILACIEMCMKDIYGSQVTSWEINPELGLVFGSKQANKFPGVLTPKAVFEIAKTYILTESKTLPMPDFDGSAKIGYSMKTDRGRNAWFQIALSIKPEWILYGK